MKSLSIFLLFVIASCSAQNAEIEDLLQEINDSDSDYVLCAPLIARVDSLFCHPDLKQFEAKLVKLNELMKQRTEEIKVTRSYDRPRTCETLETSLMNLQKSIPYAGMSSDKIVAMSLNEIKTKDEQGLRSDFFALLLRKHVSIDNLDLVIDYLKEGNLVTNTMILFAVAMSNRAVKKELLTRLENVELPHIQPMINNMRRLFENEVMKAESFPDATHIHLSLDKKTYLNGDVVSDLCESLSKLEMGSDTIKLRLTQNKYTRYGALKEVKKDLRMCKTLPNYMIVSDTELVNLN